SHSISISFLSSSLFIFRMDLFLLELWRDDCLSAVRAYSPPSTDNLIHDDGIPQFVTQFSFAIKDLVDWENERIVYRDSDDELISIDGVNGDGLLESVLDALSHWPFIYKVQYSIMKRPPMDRIRSTIVDEFPDVSFPEIMRHEPCMIVAKKEEKKEDEERNEWKGVMGADPFREFLIELEKRQDLIQENLIQHSLRRDSFSSHLVCPSVLPSDVLESIANDATKKRIVPGTPLEDHSTATDSLNELVERVERQLSLLNENTTVTTQTESEWKMEQADTEWKVEEVSPKKDGRITKFKGNPKTTVETKKQKKPSMDTKVVILKMGKANKDVHRSMENEQTVYCQSVRVMNLSRNPVQAKIVVTRRSPGAKPILYRDFVYLQPYVPTKFAIGLMDDLSEETSYVTYTLHLFNTPISPPISIFSPPSSTLIPSPHYSSMKREHGAISPPSLPLPPSLLPALPAPPRVEALPAPPQIFLSETLRGMISRKNSTEEEGQIEVENVVDDLVNGAIQNAQKEEENRTPMLIIEETAEEVDDRERDDGEIEEAEEVKVEEDESEDESMSDVEEINVENDEDSEDDSDFEVIDNHED
ncbi:hypothetical protein PRIPAC_87856, partial [Pristionchus pacificus]